MASILNLKISQGSVATHFRWGGSLYYRIHSTFPLESFSEKNYKSVNICQSSEETSYQMPCFFLAYGVVAGYCLHLLCFVVGHKMSRWQNCSASMRVACSAVSHLSGVYNTYSTVFNYA